MRALLTTFSLQELRHHPWRTASAVVAVMLGVALAFAVQLINASALAEFSSAVSAVNGQPDLELRARQGALDDALLARVAAHPDVALASPVLEWPTAVLLPGDRKLPVKIVGVDALVVARISPALMPVTQRPDDGSAARRLDIFAPDAVFLNPAAREALAREGATLDRLQVQTGLRLQTVRVAGTVNAPGAPLLVMDVAAAQELTDRVGALSRIDLRLTPGAQPDAVLVTLALPPSVIAQRPEQAGERASNLSRAYRVNLTVLALVALFTGAFLVFSMLSLSVARRQQQFALLGVLGLSAPERLRLVLAESALLGVVGSALGIALGTALAALALRVLGGDLGGGYFSGAAPPLQWSAAAAGLYGALGVAAALAGGWWPARATATIAPALALKGLGSGHSATRHHGWALALMALAVALAWAPPVGGIPLAAYVAVGLLLVGGIAALPLAVGALLHFLAPLVARHALPLLAVERSRRLRETAAVATSGVVASLALSVALTVMVASFRDSVTQWLDGVLPAQLYVRSGGSGPGDGNSLPPDFVMAVAALSGVARVDPLRATSLQLSATLPAVTLLARPLDMNEGASAGQRLPLVGLPVPLPPATANEPVVAVYVSEAMLDLHGAVPGGWLPALAQAFPAGGHTRFFVAGVWRDYARQHGSVVMDRADFVRLSGDARVNDLALHLAPGADEDAVRASIRALAASQGAESLIEFASAGQIRATSLRIFDRSFAVTYWLQAVAIGIGLFGVAASFSAQVLARRKEFGLLAHLGLTRRQILGVVALEGLAWTVLGALAGQALGLGVSLVLVHVVNPQSFHWTMDLVLPWGRLLALCVAVVIAGTATAWLAGRAAAGRDAVQAVKEDW
jgi:putative ABC transport system permease protein